MMDIQPETFYGLNTAMAFDALTEVMAQVPLKYWGNNLVHDISSSASINDIIAYLIYRIKNSFLQYGEIIPLTEIYRKYRYDGGEQQYQKLQTNVIKMIENIEDEQKIFGPFRDTNSTAKKVDSVIKDFGRAQRFISKSANENGWFE
jgi:hypothetical protein